MKYVLNHKRPKRLDCSAANQERYNNCFFSVPTVILLTITIFGIGIVNTH